MTNDRSVRCEQIMQLFLEFGNATDLARKPAADGALENLVETMLAVSDVGLDEREIIEAFEAGAAAIERVLHRLIRDHGRLAQRQRLTGRQSPKT